MGIHDRDYYRDSTGSIFDAWGRQGVTVWLIVISCVVFLAQVATGDLRAGITAGGFYDYQRVLSGEVWRLFTPIFLHIGIIPLVFNMLTIYWTGSRLEDRYGGRELVLFYLASGVFAYAAYFLTQFIGLLPPSAAIGPGPAILALLVLFACHYPREQIYFMFVIPMPVWLLVVCYVGFDIYNAIGARLPIPFSTYLAGALFGFIYYQTGWRIAGLLPGGRVEWRRRAAPQLRVVSPEPDGRDDLAEPVGAAVEAPPRPAVPGGEHFEARVDQVLEKVSRHGQESLTAEEREILFRASEVYKKRRK